MIIRHNVFKMNEGRKSDDHDRLPIFSVRRIEGKMFCISPQQAKWIQNEKKHKKHFIMV